VSDVTSTGRHGMTCRQDVLCRVDVPVVQGPAGRATPRPGGQRKLSKPMPARRADLRTRKPAIDDDQTATIPGRLVLQHGPEGAPSAVGDRFGEPPVTDHVLHRQVFDHDHIVVTDQTGTGLVQKVRAGRGDLTVSASDLRLGFGAVDPDRVSALSDNGRSRHKKCSAPGCGSGPAARPAPCSTPGVRSRTYGSTPPPAPGWG
jgi:hypothetical protein